jgi:hypothetical protein
MQGFVAKCFQHSSDVDAPAQLLVHDVLLQNLTWFVPMAMTTSDMPL